MTPYGFKWGPMTVERCATLDLSNGTYRVLAVRAGATTIYVRVSPTGRSVRVFDHAHGELKPEAT